MSLDIGDAFSMILPCPQWQDISNGPNPQWISCTSLKISSFNSIYFPPVAGGLHLCRKIVKSLLVFRENGGKGSGQSLCFSCICCSALLGLHQEDGLLRTLILYCPHLNLFCKYWGGLWRRAWKWLQIFFVLPRVLYSQASTHSAFSNLLQLSDDLLLLLLPGYIAFGGIKRRLLLGRKVMTNLYSIFKSRDITLPTNVHLVKAVVMYGCESWTEESWAPKNWWFWTVLLEKTLESPLDCKEIQPVHPKD